ncbi:MAG: nucleotidyltransferase domain-containing protein [Albidovulum sp.]|nr:nucleotidyltransferase domain-containing protein [Albidovulum sp.]MDE0253724.1 nucleotidyltransferase domain-containing protein [Rhodospirillaceae bacterium]
MSYGTIQPSQVAEQDLREAAARTLDAVPGAEAVLLFGSRARGSAQPESDWDIAVVTRGDNVRRGRRGRTPIEALHPSVNAIFLGANLLRDKRNSPGHIAREVLRNGRLLAGRMPRVGRIRRNPPMQKHEFISKSAAAKGAIYRAGQAFVDALSGTPIQAMEEDAQSFVQCSADAAEHLAKLMMFRRGVTPPRLHDLNRLAEFLEVSEPDGRWTKTAAAIRAMDGRAREHHMAAYIGVDAEDVSHAIARLQRVSEAFLDECAEAGKDPGLRDAVERQFASLRQRSAAVARNLAAAEPVPLESAAVLTKRLAADYGNESLARTAAAEAWKAGEVMRESLPVLRDLYDRLARVELPRRPAPREKRSSSSSDFSH